MPVDQSYTIDEFCKAERISRGKLYLMWKKGEGPDFYRIGNRPRITHAARIAWQQRHVVKQSAPVGIDDEDDER